MLQNLVRETWLESDLQSWLTVRLSSYHSMKFQITSGKAYPHGNNVSSWEKAIVLFPSVSEKYYWVFLFVRSSIGCGLNSWKAVMEDMQPLLGFNITAVLFQNNLVSWTNQYDQVMVHKILF